MELGPSTSSTDPATAPRRPRPAARPPAGPGRLPAWSVAVTVLAVLVGLLAATPASAGEGDPDDPPTDPAPTALSLHGGRATAGAESTLRVRLTAETGEPVAGASVTVERRVDGDWSSVATLTTDGDGAAAVPATLRRDADDNVFRARFAGDAAWAASGTGPVRVALRKVVTRVALRGPARVVDGREAVLRLRVRSAGGAPLAVPVQLQRRDRTRKAWRTTRVVRTGEDGRAQVRVRPRVDSRWRLRVRPGDWRRGDVSPVLRIDNVPPGDPVRLPAGAPRPRVKLPPQSRASGRGAHPVVSAIPDGVWRSMVGRSWHAGCPVGRSGLRLLRINYWGYDGYRYRGEVVAAAGAVGQMSAALAEMYQRRLPIRSMYRVDRFGWSRRLQGADDYRSMAAGNTSAFNCRHVVGRPGVRSPHSYGRSLDVNPWENPYRASHGWTPNSWWVGRSHPRVAWRSSSHRVVALMRRHGLRWTYGTSDSHHFDATGSSGRVLVPRGCAGAETCK